MRFGKILSRLAREETGQVSAELIIVIAAVLAIAILLVKSLTETATEARDEMDAKSKEVMDKIKDIK